MNIHGKHGNIQRSANVHANGKERMRSNYEMCPNNSGSKDEIFEMYEQIYAKI